MNTASNSTPATLRPRFRPGGYFLLAVVPLILIAVWLLVAAVQQQQAAASVRAELERLRAAGRPVDNGSLQRWFAQHASREGTRSWHELLRLVAAAPARPGSPSDLPYLGNAQPPAEITPDGAWDDEPAVAEFLLAMRPVIQQMHAAGQHPAPVWQPVEFRGYETLLEELQNSRQVVRLLQLEVEHAVYRRDAERAYRALRTMEQAAAQFDWQFCIVGELVQIALRDTHRTMILRCLAVDIWDPEQLRGMAEQVGPPRELATRWANVLNGERALLLSSLEDSKFWLTDESPSALNHWVLRLPSTRNQLLEQFRALDGLAAEDPATLARRADQWERDLARESGARRSLLRLPERLELHLLPAISGLAGALERDETSRRFTLTALAIKQYEMSAGDWPEQLEQIDQLEASGLRTGERRTVSGGGFGYERHGSEALLWYVPPAAQGTWPPGPAPPIPQVPRHAVLATIR
ncbi:MAG: hypothetical protein J5I93_21295 [Pirellulaceae bacterium]|nr:hypothetical protein [Pirellulaceae bacterium]